MFNGKTRWGYLCIESKIKKFHFNRLWLFPNIMPCSSVLALLYDGVERIALQESVS